MRVLVTGRCFATFRGQELGIFEKDQALALAAMGHDVRFAAMDTRSLFRFRPLGSRMFQQRGLRIFLCSLPGFSLSAPLAGSIEGEAVRRLWRAVTADGWTPEIIHGHFGAAFAPLAAERGIPYVYTEHFSGRNRLLPPTEAEKLREEYALADCVVAVSRALSDNIRRNTGISARVIHNIVDVETFQPQRRSHPGFRFVTAANLVPIKRVDMLLEAFALAGVENSELTIFGDGPEGIRLRSLAEQRHISERVNFRGNCPRSTLAEEYARSDCYVISSQAETFCLAGAEAMAAGLPVISTRCGGPEDYIDEENGLFVPADDAEAMAASMREMAENNARYDSAKIALRARTRFSPEAVARRLTDVYGELTENKAEQGVNPLENKGE